MGMRAFGRTMLIKHHLRHALLPPDVAGCRAGSWRFRPATFFPCSSTLRYDVHGAMRIGALTNDLGKERHDGPHLVGESKGRVRHEKPSCGKRGRSPLRIRWRGAGIELDLQQGPHTRVQELTGRRGNLGPRLRRIPE